MKPLTSAEEAYWRAALGDAPTVHGLAPSNTSLVAITTAEWADRCRRLFATLDAVRAGSASDEGSLDAAWDFFRPFVWPWLTDDTQRRYIEKGVRDAILSRRRSALARLRATSSPSEPEKPR